MGGWQGAGHWARSLKLSTVTYRNAIAGVPPGQSHPTTDDRLLLFNPFAVALLPSKIADESDVSLHTHRKMNPNSSPSLVAPFDDDDVSEDGQVVMLF